MSVLNISLFIAPTDCWSCGAEFEIVSAIRLARADEAADCEVADFTDFPNLAAQLSDQLSTYPRVGALKRRFSATVGKDYLSNGCAHCDALFGKHFEISTRYDERLAVTFEAPAADGWSAFLNDLRASDDGHLFH